MLLLVTLVPFPGLTTSPASWAACLWLCAVLVPVATVLVAVRRRSPRPMAVSRRHPASTSRSGHANPMHPYQRTCLRWPTCFPIRLLVAPGRSERAGTGAPVQRHPFRCLEGVVVDISAGDMRVRLSEPVLPRTRVQVDPEWTGPYPLAGVHGQVVSCRAEAGQTYLQVRFVGLPERVEAGIVRRINRHQLGIRTNRHGSLQPSPPWRRPHRRHNRRARDP